MGIHNSSSLSLEQRVANPKNIKKNNMKAFTTACALIGASASADSQFYTAPMLHGAGVLPQTAVPVYGPVHPLATATTAYTGAAAAVVPTVGYVAPAVAAIRPATVTVTASAPAVTGVAHQTSLFGVQRQVVAGPVVVGAPGLIKREADAEAGEFQYQTKVENPKDQSKYEYSVKVDHKGNGKSYQYHEQKNEDKMSDVYNLDDDHMGTMKAHEQDHHHRNMMEQHRQRNMVEQHRQRNMLDQHRQRNMVDQHRQRNMVNSNQMMEQQHQQRNMVDMDQHRQRNMIDTMYQHRQRNMIDNMDQHHQRNMVDMEQHRRRNMVNQDQIRMGQQNQRQMSDRMMNQQQE